MFILTSDTKKFNTVIFILYNQYRSLLSTFFVSISHINRYYFIRIHLATHLAFHLYQAIEQAYFVLIGAT